MREEAEKWQMKGEKNGIFLELQNPTFGFVIVWLRYL